MKSKATKWFIIWIILFQIVSTIMSVYSVYYAVVNDLPEMSAPYSVKMVVAVIALVFFCPSLFLIHRQAKKESAKAIGIVSVVLLVILVFGLLLGIVQMN